MNVRKGEFVRVTDTRSVYDGKLCKVRGLRPGGIVEVEFGKASGLAPSIFRQSELKPVLVSPEETATFLFGRDWWHHVSMLADPLNVRTLCYNRLCVNTVTQRVMVNLSGCVCEVDVCDGCALSWAGARADTFPFRHV